MPRSCGRAALGRMWLAARDKVTKRGRQATTTEPNLQCINNSSGLPIKTTENKSSRQRNELAVKHNNKVGGERYHTINSKLRNDFGSTVRSTRTAMV